MRKGVTVTLDRETIERIRGLGVMGESYDDVIKRVLDELYGVRNTRVMIGRKRVFEDVFEKRLVAKDTYYSVSSEELVSSYRPFLSLLKTSTKQLGGSSKIMTDVVRSCLGVVNELVHAGAEVRHLEKRIVRRCAIYDSSVAYFSILEKPLIKRLEVDTISEAEGRDMWTRSTEETVISEIKDLFMSDWQVAQSLDDRINAFARTARDTDNHNTTTST